ncbi:MAG: helix-turn-helix transcriptional regulator [Labilithrix sp.]|nr:helix-turn-helix transcriptional regulator [Labilithrix sp.]
MTRPIPNKANGFSRTHKADSAAAKARVAAAALDAPAERASATGAPNVAAARPAGRSSHERDVCGPEEHARRARLTVVSDEQLERAAAIFRAAGDVSRLKLLHRLSDGEWCVTELADAAGVGLSTVSQQLRLLRAERIVARRRAGKHIFYSLADSHVSDLIHSAIEHAAEPHGHDKHEDRHDDGDAT